MSNKRREAKALDDALDGASTTDHTQPLTETADSVRRSLATDVPPADRTRALFLSGVAERERARFSPVRVLVPALALAIVTLTGLAGQSALPGQGLYPVREAMNSVGIGRSPVAEIDEHCKEALALIGKAEASIDTNPEQAIALAVLAIEQLGPARELLPELNGGQRGDWVEWVEDLEEDAVEIIAEASEEENEGSDDNSGHGSGDFGSNDSGGHDNSRSGSDDSGGDNSGSGSDDSGSGSDDSGGHDNSGSGSDDSGSGSESGSGSDDSGSGSDHSGSGSDDSSDSGSGD